MITTLVGRTIATLVAVIHTAHAQSAIDIQIIHTGMPNSEPPRLIVKANQDAPSLDIQAQCGPIQAHHKGALESGKTLTIPIHAPQGSWTCTGKVVAQLGDGGVGTVPLDFDIHVLPALSVAIDLETQDLAAGHLDLSVNRDVRSFVIEAFGMDGLPIEHLSQFVGAVPSGHPIALDWSPKETEVLRFRIRAEDGLGFTVQKNIFPVFFEIPHRDVRFPTTESTLRPREEPKLEEAWAEIDSIMRRLGVAVPFNLYVGGYTDTVGSRSANLKLSTNRAMVLAQWFRDKGFTGEIWYQGFGEDGQAITTGDEVDLEANRRALYHLSAGPPSTTGDTPTGHWVRLH